MFSQPLKTATTIVAVAAGTLLLAISSATAHHSFALFDMTKTLDVEGSVKKFEWSNPHSWIVLEVTSPQNTVDEWIVELPAAASLVREGWNKNFVKPGEKLLVRINPLKNGQKGGSLTSFSQEH